VTHDLVVAGGHVLCPATGADAVADVAIDGGCIAEVGEGLSGRERVDASGLLVVPGLIDLHTHVFPGLGDFCVHPDRAGVDVGVPVVVDGGTSGVRTFGLARSFLERPDVHTRVLALLDPCLLYLATRDFIAHKLEIANDPRNLDLEATAAALEEHADVVVGCKVRATTVDDPRRSPFLDGAKEVAGERPIMIHLGRYPYTPSLSNLDAIATLRPGDVVTHAFRGHSGILAKDGGGVAPQFRDAVDAGVRLDVGHSGADFRFETARRLFDLGYLPSTVSTDLNLFNEGWPVGSLPETMSKIWALGVELADVVAMATCNTAAAIRRGHELGCLAPGRAAEVSVLRVQEAGDGSSGPGGVDGVGREPGGVGREPGGIALSDGVETIHARRRLVPVGCLRGGVWHEAVHAGAAVPPATPAPAA
jgi:dihydroorotase